MHVPEGSLGKEGPSVRMAILSAFVNMPTSKQVNPDIGHGVSLVYLFFSLRCVFLTRLTIAMLQKSRIFVARLFFVNVCSIQDQFSEVDVPKQGPDGE